MLKNSTVVTVLYDKNFKNRMFDLMHEHGMLRILHYIPVFDRNGEVIGVTATIRANKMILRLIDFMYNRNGVKPEPFVLEKNNFDVI